MKIIMKRNWLLMAVLMIAVAGLTSFKANSAVDEIASLHFSSMVYDFGKIKKGVPVSYDFEFSNPAEENILITKVTASCGCTVTEYTREEVAPGKNGFVQATYNAAKVGVFSKTVSVYHSGSETPIVLTIKGEVVE